MEFTECMKKDLILKIDTDRKTVSGSVCVFVKKKKKKKGNNHFYNISIIFWSMNTFLSPLLIHPYIFVTPFLLDSNCVIPVESLFTKHFASHKDNLYIMFIYSKVISLLPNSKVNVLWYKCVQECKHFMIQVCSILYSFFIFMLDVTLV